jgi:hypothetical protein
MERCQLRSSTALAPKRRNTLSRLAHDVKTTKVFEKFGLRTLRAAEIQFKKPSAESDDPATLPAIKHDGSLLWPTQPGWRRSLSRSSPLARSSHKTSSRVQVFERRIAVILFGHSRRQPSRQRNVFTHFRLRACQSFGARQRFVRESAKKRR